MTLARRLLLLLLILVLTGAALICLSPVIVTDSIRLYALWKGRAQGVKIEFGQIESPLFRPVVLHRVRVTTVRPCAYQVAFSAQRMEIDLNLRALLFRTGARVVHTLTIDGMHGTATRSTTPGQVRCHFDWPMLQDLIADNLRVTDFSFQLDNGATQFGVRGVDFTASQIEAGRFRAEEIRVATPWFHQQFQNLRGATSWENERVTIGALSLARGIDVDTLTTDLSRLDKKSIGFELKLDAFGGKLRASVATENRQHKVLWTAAGTASDISLAQMSTALDLASPANGAVRASKFTFRGDIQNLARATASVWAEVNDFTWRDRRAEVIMIGASLYNRRIDVSQFYVKQRENQFTLNGEYLLPEKSADWLNPNFRADISASIADLGNFARLFGAPADRFSGALSIVGTLNGRERNIGGHLTAQGTKLELFGAPFDDLNAQLSLKKSVLAIDQLQARHGQSLVKGEGQIDLAHAHDYSGSFNAALTPLADYQSFLPEPWKQLQPTGSVTAQWKGRGNSAQHSGEFQIDGADLQLAPRFGLRPFTAHVAGDYAPGRASVRELTLTNDSATLATSLHLTNESLQLPSLRFDLGGQSKLQGKISIPFSWTNWKNTHVLRRALDPRLKFDVDLKLEPVDLHEVSSAIYTLSATTGQLSGALNMSGSLSELQSRAEAHLTDFSQSETTKTSGDATITLTAHSLDADAHLTFGHSSPVTLQAKIPLQLAADDDFLARDQSFSAAVDLPAVILAQLPRLAVGSGFRDGFLTGKITAQQTLRSPSFSGDLQLLNARLRQPSGSLNAFSGRAEFAGNTLNIPFAHFEIGNARLPWHGAVTLSSSSDLRAQFFPETTLTNLSASPGDRCISSLQFFPVKQPEHFLAIDEIEMRGSLTNQKWSLTVHHDSPAPSLRLLPSPRFEDVPLCASGGKPLLLGAGISTVPDALSVFRGRAHPANSPLP